MTLYAAQNETNAVLPGQGRSSNGTVSFEDMLWPLRRNSNCPCNYKLLHN